MNVFRTPRLSARVLLVLAVLASIVFWAAPVARAEETVTLGSHTVTYYGVLYDYPANGQSTWFYRVVSVGSPAISHTVFQITCSWIKIVGAGTWSGATIETATLNPGGGSPDPSSWPTSPIYDPTTAVTGLKFDEGFDSVKTKYYYFTVNGNLAEGDITVAVKTGKDKTADPPVEEKVYTATTVGPSLLCDLATASLGDYVWLDDNVNGIQDAGEIGVQNAKVDLFSAGGALLGTTYTDASGYYLFTNLAAGDYYVVFTPPLPLYSFTDQDGGANDALDSDANPANGQTQVVNLGWGVDYRDLDAGLYIPGTPSAVDVTSFDVSREDDTLLFTWTTGQELLTLGFDLLAVEPGSEDWIQINETTILVGLVEGQLLEPQDYAYEVERPDISVDASFYLRVYATFGGYEDVGPVQAVLTTEAAPPTLRTGPEVPVPCVPGEEGCRPVAQPRSAPAPSPDPVRPAKPAAPAPAPVVGPALPPPVVPGPGNTSPLAVDDSAASPECYDTAKLGDYVWLDEDEDGRQDWGEDGVADVSVKLYDGNGTWKANATTDSSGHYYFSSLASGSYYVKFVLPSVSGYTCRFTSQNATYDDKDSDADVTTGKTSSTYLSEGETDLTWDAGIVCTPVATAKLGDFVWVDLDEDGFQDTGEPGVPGVTVELYTGDGTWLATTTTDGSGYYLFEDLAYGSYYVKFILPTDAAYLYSFTIQDAGGSSWDHMGDDSDADQVTGETDAITLTSWLHDYRGLDAGVIRTALASVSNFVWQDLNLNGIQDAGEPGILGAKVELFDAGGTLLSTTYTDATGYYIFAGLLPGSYSLRFSPPSDPNYIYYPSPQNQGSDVLDSDADPASGYTASITLSAGENNEDLDAGYLGIPTTPSAVTISSFEVLRDNDTLRFKWTTAQELNNSGFDIFAVEPGSETWIQVNEATIPAALGEGQMLEPHDYYYQVERPDIAIGAVYYLRAIDRDGGHEDFGPVEAIYTAMVAPSAPPMGPEVPVPCVPGEEGCRPVAEPRSEPAPSLDPVRPAKPAAPVVGPELPGPGPVAPRLGGLRPGLAPKPSF